MLGERLAEIRKNYHDTQKSLADKLGLTVWAVSAWEQGRNSPPSDVLLAICKLYGTSADYLLGLTDIDPSDEARKQRQRLTKKNKTRCTATKNICCGNAKNKPPSETVRSLGGCCFTQCIQIFLSLPADALKLFFLCLSVLAPMLQDLHKNSFFLVDII